MASGAQNITHQNGAWCRGRVEITPQTAHALDAYWRCANYLSVGQIYLRANPLLRRPLAFSDVKPRPIGHWGTVPGLNFLFAHINRLIADHSQRALVIIGPGHGGTAGAVASYIDGTYGERYHLATDDETGLAEFMRTYSAPDGMPQNCTPMLPGSIHTGGELGYTLGHAFGAAFDNPAQLIVPIVGDGEAEEGAIAASWSASRIMNPATDGMVLPILHMNGYKITTPSMIAATSAEEREMFFRGLGYDPVTFTVGFDDEDPISFHTRFAELLEDVFDRMCAIKERAETWEQVEAQGAGDTEAATAAEASVAPASPGYPLIIFQSPKGWTTPVAPDGTPFEDTAAIHEVPMRIGTSEECLRWLEGWLKSYHAEELFDADGGVCAEVHSVVPVGELRLGANPIADGGRVREPLALPDPSDFALLVEDNNRGMRRVGLAGMCGDYTREIMRANPNTFRLFSPDELSSNRMDASLEVTGKQWNITGYAEAAFDDAELDLVPSGQVVEVLSEHLCEGMLEGYILTGRHGIWATYEAFAQIVGSMVGQHCKWLEETVRYARWREPISSLNILLTSHVWRQDHNGFSHQDPGFVDVLLNKASAADHIVNIYYPADANMMLAVVKRCYASTDCVNALVAGKHESPVFLTLAEAEAELSVGAAVWPWASSSAVRAGQKPQLVVASVGDSITVEALEVAKMVDAQGINVQFVNVVDLLRLESPRDDANALSDEAFEELFPQDVPVLFCFHGYEGQLLRVLARRADANRFDVHGYRDQGSTTTPFGMLYANNMDRFALAAAALELVDATQYADAVDELLSKRDFYMDYTVANGVDHRDLGLM